MSPDLRAALTIAHAYGWRTQTEVMTLARRQLDLKAGTLRLEPGMNGDGREVRITAELRSLLAEQFKRIKALERTTGRIGPYLFPHLSGPRFVGERRCDFRKLWRSRARPAGVEVGLSPGRGLGDAPARSASHGR